MSGRLRAVGRRAWRIVRRPVIAVLTILIASFIIFAALTHAPGDPVAQLLGPHPTPQAVAATRHKLGLDQGLLTRYWIWLKGAVHGDFGDTIVYRAPVTSLLGPRLQTSAFLVAYAGLLCVVIGIGLGVLAALARRARPLVAVGTAVGVAIPAFLAASLLIAVFAVNLGWFPTGGAGQGFTDRIWHLTLPAFALAVSWAAYLTQVTRSALVEQQHREHVQMANARGLAPMHVFTHHVARNAAPPVLTITGLTFAGLIVGTVIVESAFGINGIGSFLVTSIEAKDYNVVLALSLIVVVAFVLITNLLEMVEVALDPRLRAASRA